MISALIALLLSWALLHFVEKQSLEVLGFRPTARRLRLVGVGVVLTAVYMTGYYLLEAGVWHTAYHLNNLFFPGPFFAELWRLFTSALFEELVFRGALLYILIRRLGPLRAVLISSVAFGMYHWWLIGIHSFSQMLLLFLSMAWLGDALARSFVVTGSILVPFALHYTSNVIGLAIFGDGPQPFVHAPGVHPGAVMILLLTLIHSFIYPLLILGWLRSVKSNQGLLARFRGNK
jgi:membrane protease YdiL (CAAX protease family)